MAALIVGSASAGFLWAVQQDTAQATLAALMTSFAVLMAYFVERLATSAEHDLQSVAALLTTNIKETAEGIVISDEKIRELDRIIDMLSVENTDFRGRLLGERVRGMDEARRQQKRDASSPRDGRMQ